MLRRRPVVAGQQHGADALLLHLPDGGGAGLLHRVRHGDQAQQGAAPGEVHGGLALGGEPLRVGGQGRHIHALLLQQAAVAGQDGLAVQLRLQAPAGQVLKPLRAGGAAEAVGLGVGGDGVCQGMGGHRLHRCGGGQQVVSRALIGQDLRHGGGALGDGAGLVQHHRVHTVGDLQDLTGADQDAVPGAQARAHHDGGGGGQAQGAGAGDDQHRREHPQHEGEGLPGDGPEDGRHQGDPHDHRHEHAGHLVGGLGDGGLPALGVLHEPDDPGEGGVVAHAGHLDVQHAVFVDAAADDLAARSLLHRQTLAGEHGLVDAALPLGDGAVRRDPGAGLHQHHVAHLQLAGGDLPAGVRQDGGVRGQLHQGGDGALGLLHVPALQELAQRHQGQHHGGGLIIEVVDIAGIVGDQEGHHQAVGKGAAGADGHQGVHVGVAVEQGLEAPVEEVAAAVQHRHGQDQLQHREVHGMGVHGENVRQGQGRQPEGQHLPHGHIQQHRGEHRRRDQLVFSPLQGSGLRVLGVLDRSRGRMVQVQGGAEARLLHLGHNLLLGALTFIVCNGHDACRQVHLAALHAGQLPGDPLHGRAARGAVHPGDVIFFFPHDSLPSAGGRYPPGVFFLRPNIYP